MSMDTDVAEVEFVPEKTGTLRYVPKHLAIFLVLVIVWEVANRASLLDPLLFPRPTGIVAGMWSIFVAKAGIWPHLGSTFGKAMGGFAIGTLIGMALATGAALSAGFRDYLKPYIILVEAMPRIAVGPIFIAALGFGWSSAVALAALVCFFAPFVNTMTGLMQVDEETWFDAAASWAAKRVRGELDFAGRAKLHRSLMNRGFNHGQASAAFDRLNQPES